MDDSLMEDSMMDDYGDSDAFSPVAPVKKAKAAPKKPTAPKASAGKMIQTKLTKTAPKKRAKPDSDDENDSIMDHDSMHDDSLLSNTPPTAKKQKKAPATKKATQPLAEVSNVGMDDSAMPKTKKSGDSATDRYQKITQLDHIVKRPDTYIGSVERTEQQMWVFNSESEQMELRKVSFVPGLYKIFDEILVNAADNKVRDQSMKSIKVTIDRESGEISVENDGKGIPVEIHGVEKIYIPEMIFGHLLTSSNYDDDEAKVTGGRNGYGAKLCNIFSTQFTLETQDNVNVKRYKQTWTDNMSKMGKASIKTNKSSDFTRVTFTPDYKRFGMTGIDDDFEGLVKRRVYDMAGTLKGVAVSLNGTKIKINRFEQYIKMYTKAINAERGIKEEAGTTADANKVIIDDESNHRRWEIGFAVSDGSFQQVSFVNSIATTSGGTHVNYIADQICTRLLEVVKKKNKQGSALKLNQIKNHIFLFVNCLITNPAFTSQTKEQLTTKVSQFGSKCVLSDAFLTKVSKTEAVENILHFAQQKADKELSKSDGNRRSRMSNPKLVDANLAGTKRGWECTLILTEGESAKGLAVAGRAVLDPDKIGVFPLRGKLLNVRDASIDQISKNAEIQAIKQFLGLKHKATYEDTKTLRYGHLMIMADQDHDGSHIKGLLINFLQVQFPSLLKLPDFFREFITPIVKVWKGNNPKKQESVRSFFTMPQYYEWKEQHKAELRKWQHKYYKGLGTSSTQDAQVYFRNLDDHLKEFQPIKKEEEELFELAFSKKKADARKAWLGQFIPGTFLDHSSKVITYDNFVNQELILFSMADNLRSIPSVIDGLKPGQRKVMYAAFNRPVVKDMKVVELAGYVSELTAYQHGEASLHSTIIGLAQDFIGSNNVNLLEPSGNFGSRLSGGSDAASPRYIYTRLSPFARAIFSSKDEPNLEYNTDDDRKIEPKVYCPVVPLLLLNGADGIGTGWSTSIPNYKPEDIVENLKRRMGRLEGQDEEGEFQSMTPWFRNWKGVIEAAGPDRYKCNGIAIATGDNEVEVTELPLRVWTDDFKARLEEIIKGEKTPSFIKDYKEFNDHNSVHFIIQMDEKHMKAALAEGLEERFKLQKTIATSNLVAFDSHGRIRKYDKVEDILEEFYVHRLQMYTVQKTHWLQVHGKEFRKFSNQARFVTEIIDNKLIVSRKKKPVLVAELRKAGYEAFPNVKDAKKAGEADDVVENTDDPADEDGGARDFDYLLGMPIWSLTQERVDRLKQQMVDKKKQLDDLKALSEKDLWCADLDEFLKVWNAREVEEDEIKRKIRSMGRRVSKKLGVGKSSKAGARMRVDDDYAPKAPKPKASAKAGVLKVEAPKKTTQQKMTGMFGTTAASLKVKSSTIRRTFDGTDEDKTEATDAAISDDEEFDAIKPSRAASVQPSEGGRTKRAAAAKPKNWMIDDDDDSDALDDDDLGDIGHMVKGIGASDSTDATAGRVSLYGMSRPDSAGRDKSSAEPVRAKVKPKAIDLNEDETNYEALAQSSPQRPAATANLDSFLSNDSDEDMLAAPVAKPKAKTVTKPKAPAAKKPVAAPAKAKVEPKPVGLSPAAKAYAAKKLKKKNVISDDEDGMAMSDSPAPISKPIVTKAKAKTAPAAKSTATRKKPVISSDDDDLEVDMGGASLSPPVKAAAGRGRPARAAAVAKPKKSAYVELSDDDEDEDRTLDFEKDGDSAEDDEDEDDFEDSD